ncbi:MAG: hypothetical protein ACKOOF_07485 [Planctomycetaceae bacterium]
MSIASSPRRDQRRRMLVSWKRSASTGAAGAGGAARAPAEYAAEAAPERQRGPAVLLPTTAGGLAFTIIAILLPVAGSIALGACEAVVGMRPITATGRFARTFQAVEACVDPKSIASLQAWLAQLFLVTAAGIACIVRLMRRHRRDDYHGRFRAWGWLAGLFLLTACAGVVPVGPLVAALAVDVTGIEIGPGGVGWWLTLAATAYGLVALWAVLPLHERLGTAFWLVAALGAWAGSAAAVWVGQRWPLHAVAAGSLWSLAAAFAVIAMLTAARSVIREVRGLTVRKPAASRPVRAEPTAAIHRRREEDAEVAEEEEAPDFTATDDQADETAFTDGSEPEHRHLSKAERKRLKKLARMREAAA